MGEDGWQTAGNSREQRRKDRNQERKRIATEERNKKLKAEEALFREKELAALELRKRRETAFSIAVNPNVDAQGVKKSSKKRVTRKKKPVVAIGEVKKENQTANVRVLVVVDGVNMLIWILYVF